MEFLKAAPGVEFDVRGECRIGVELQFREMKGTRDCFGMVQKQIAKALALLVWQNSDVFNQEARCLRNDFNQRDRKSILLV